MHLVKIGYVVPVQFLSTKASLSDFLPVQDSPAFCAVTKRYSHDGEDEKTVAARLLALEVESTKNNGAVAT